MEFNNTVFFGESIEFNDNPEVTKLFPQLYRADLEFARSFKNSVLNSIIDSIILKNSWKYFSVDTRTHMLNPGWFPCIPGWHCDDFYRPTNRQPDLQNVLLKAPAEHAMVLLGDCSLTEFLTPCELPVLCFEDKPIYGEYHNLIENKRIDKFKVDDKRICYFGPTDFHQGVAATKAGWRYFIRITGSNHHMPVNQLRPQTQVYIPEPYRGW